jgi:hypothetical protein
MCDTLCLAHSGGMLFAKNSDRPVNEAQIIEVLAPHRRSPSSRLRTQYLDIDDPGDGLLTVVSRPTWLWGAEHAVNAAGVAIGNEKVWTTDDPRTTAPALLGMDLVRLVGERATTADGAVDLLTAQLEQWGQGGSGEHDADEPYWSSFLVADPAQAWVVETSGRSWVAEPLPVGSAEGGGSISNRLTLADRWTRSSADIAVGTNWQSRLSTEVPTAVADHRLAATRTLVASPSAERTPAALVAGLRDHGTGPWGAPGAPDARGLSPAAPVPDGLGDDLSGVTVCMHVRDYQCTTATMVANLPSDPHAPLRLWAAIGPPCCTGVLPGVMVRQGTPEAVIAPALGDPSLWAAASRAARDAEVQGPEGQEALTELRRRVGTIEAEAWAEADDLEDRQASTRQWQTATHRWGQALLEAFA